MTYICLHCSRTFATSYALKRHISETSRLNLPYEEPGLWDDDLPYEEHGLWDDDLPTEELMLDVLPTEVRP